MYLKIIKDKLIIDLDLHEKIFSVRGSFGIPLSHISKVSTDAPESSWLDLRAPGTSLPGVIRAGTYFSKRGKEFWYVTGRKQDRYLVLSLIDESYKKIIIQMDDNERWKDKIRKALDSK